MDSEEFSLLLSIIKIITVDYCIDESFELREKKLTEIELVMLLLSISFVVVVVFGR